MTLSWQFPFAIHLPAIPKILQHAYKHLDTGAEHILQGAWISSVSNHYSLGTDSAQLSTEFNFQARLEVQSSLSSIYQQSS